MTRFLATALIALVCGGAAGALAGRDDEPAAPQSPIASPAAAPRTTAAATYRRDAPGVVQITSIDGPGEQSLGSGFVIDPRGDIVTNDHVVAGGTGIRVGFSDGGSYPATVVGMDAASDLAVIHVNAPASKLHPVAFDDSSKLQVGETVFAIGNPFGLDRTMTAGIVSATGRDIQAPDGLTIPDAIQTDAAINHGNSGGPLLDGEGHVVGVTSQIQGGTVDANVGVGFAIPSNTARSVAQQLIDHGTPSHAWLGVQLRATSGHGVVVEKVVPGGPAARAGLQGDAIVAIDGRRIATTAQLADAVAHHRPGDTVRLEAVRNGAQHVVRVKLGNAPQSSSS